MKAGAAEADITPDFEVELSGFALRTQPAIGVLESVRARCIYLEDDAHSRLLWLTADVLALEAELVEDFEPGPRSSLGCGPSR